MADYGADGIPANRVQVACELLSDNTLEGSNLLRAMVSATSVFTGNASVSGGCLDITGAAPEPEPEPEPYGPAEAPAGDVAALIPKAEPETVPSSNLQQSSAGDNATDAVFLLSAGDKFGYQVRCARSPCGDGTSVALSTIDVNHNITSACHPNTGVHGV